MPEAAVRSGVREGSTGPVGSPYAAQVITKVPNWDILTALDVLLNNLAVGTFLAGALCWLRAPAHFGPILPWALLLALVLLGADLLLLVGDLGDPWRFHHMLRVFKPRAPMSLGTWSLSLCSASRWGLPHWHLYCACLAAPIGWTGSWAPQYGSP